MQSIFCKNFQQETLHNLNRRVSNQACLHVIDLLYESVRAYYIFKFVIVWVLKGERTGSQPHIIAGVGTESIHHRQNLKKFNQVSTKL